MKTQQRWITFTARLDEIRFGLFVVETCVTGREWAAAHKTAKEVRRMIEAAEQRISGRRKQAKRQGGLHH